MSTDESVFQNQILELRRGSIVIAIVGILAKRTLYGYALLKELELYNVPVDGGTLYPLLRRLEKQGVLSSIWQVTENRPRKYYSLTKDGALLHRNLADEWTVLNQNITKILEK